MMPAEEYSYVSSRLVKEVFHLGAPIKDLVPPLVRLLHIKLIAEWEWDWLVGLALEGVARAYGHKKYGYASVEMGIWRLAHGVRRSFYLLTAPRAYAEQFFLSPSVLDLDHPIGMPADWEMA